MTSGMSKVWSVTQVVLARLRFLSVFLIVGLVVGYWDNIKNHVDKWTRPAIPPDMLLAVGDIEYYCAMHPSVIRSAPGDCPICGMPLIKRKKGTHEELPVDVMARVQISPQRVAMAGVGTTVVQRRVLKRTIDAVGVIDFDERRLAQLAARVAGRADRLFLQYVGQSVKKGQEVYAIYSPEVYTATREYLQARKRVNDMGKGAQNEARMDASDVYNASMQKLLLWGVTREQLDRLDEEFDRAGTVPTDLAILSPIDGIVVKRDVLEGGYLQVGEPAFTIADLTRVWLKIKIYENDVPLVHLGDKVQVTVAAMAAREFEGTVTYLGFGLDPQTRTMLARVEVDNADLTLRPGMYADARLEASITAADLKAAATQRATTQAAPTPYADAYFQSLQPYLEAQKKLSSDSAEGVSALLHSSVAKFEKLEADSQFKPMVERYTLSVHQTMGKDLAGIREAFTEISAAMIDLGKAASIPADSPALGVYRCPMKKASWIQPIGNVLNPYYGSEMLTCGGIVEPLPRAEVLVLTGSARPATGAEKVLAVPLSAVIQTGKRAIVYVKSNEGVFDMKQVTLGPVADDWYPVVQGLAEGDVVVTAGAFLIDAENRLNPPVAAPAPSPESAPMPKGAQ